MNITELSTRYGHWEAKWLDAQIKSFWEKNASIGDFVSAGDWRVARNGDAKDERAYEEVREQDVDTLPKHYDTMFANSPMGYAYRFGFNYGVV